MFRGLNNIVYDGIRTFLYKNGLYKNVCNVIRFRRKSRSLKTMQILKTLKKIVGSNNFSSHFIKMISHYKKIGYYIYVLQQTACLLVNPITVATFALLFNCTPVGQTSDSMTVPT